MRTHKKIVKSDDYYPNEYQYKCQIAWLFYPFKDFVFSLFDYFFSLFYFLCIFHC